MPAAGSIPSYKIRAFDAAANASAFSPEVPQLTAVIPVCDETPMVRICSERTAPGKFSILFSGDQTADVNIYTILGKYIGSFSAVVSGQQLQFPAGIPSGMYTLQVKINKNIILLKYLNY